MSDSTDVVAMSDSADVVDVTGTSEPANHRMHYTGPSLDKKQYMQQNIIVSCSRTSLFLRSSALARTGLHCLATRRASDKKPGHSVTISDQFVVVNAHRWTARRIQLSTEGRLTNLYVCYGTLRVRIRSLRLRIPYILRLQFAPILLIMPVSTSPPLAMRKLFVLPFKNARRSVEALLYLWRGGRMGKPFPGNPSNLSCSDRTHGFHLNSPRRYGFAKYCAGGHGPPFGNRNNVCHASTHKTVRRNSIGGHRGSEYETES